MAEPFVGQIQMWGCNFAPRNWVMCTGDTLTIDQDTMLYAVIFNAFGGNGHTTFQVPHLQGRVPLGTGQGPGLSPHPLGYPVGYSQIALSEPYLPMHTHTSIKVALDRSEQSSPSPQTVVGLSMSSTGQGAMFNDTSDGTVDMAANALTSFGGSQSHENRQPFLAVNFCIARLGEWPQRPS